MIVPANRLLGWVAAAAAPLAIAATSLPAAFKTSLLGLAVLLAVAALDAVFSLGLLAGLSVRSTGALRISKNRDGQLELLVQSDAAPQPDLLLGLPLPPVFQAAQESIRVTLPEAGKSYRVRYPFRPVKRGRYLLQSCHVQRASRLGFWMVRARLPMELEVRVYPDLREEHKRAAMFMRRGLAGIQLHRQVGKGREFEKLREYQPGDSYEDIHWRATAKRRMPVTKLFRIERTQEVYAVVDASRLSARAAIGVKVGDDELEPTYLERFIGSALMLGAAAEGQGDRFGLITFSARPRKCLRAGKGAAHYNACRDALYTLEPELETPDFGELCSLVRTRLRKRGLLVFLTSLDDPLLAESFLESIKLVCRQHLVVVMMVRPPGAEPLFSQAVAGSVQDVYRQLAGHMIWQRLAELDKDLRRQGVRMVQTSHERLSADLVSHYMEIKQKQLI